MKLFTQVENAFVILLIRGEYRQVDCFERAGFLYAAHGRGFVRLLGQGATSVPTVRYDAIEGTPVSYVWNGVVQRSAE